MTFQSMFCGIDTCVLTDEELGTVSSHYTRKANKPGKWGRLSLALVHRIPADRQCQCQSLFQRVRIRGCWTPGIANGFFYDGYQWRSDGERSDPALQEPGYVLRPTCKLAAQGKGNIRHVIVCQSQQSEYHIRSIPV